MADYSRFETIKVEKADGIATIALNRPDALNAVNQDMHHELEEAFEIVAHDSEVNVVVLTGEGRAFSAGGDVRGMKARLDDRSAPRPTLDGPRRIIRNLVDIPQPVIAAVNGDAIGLGATLALFCDIIIAAEKARFGDPHVRVGLVAGDGGAVIWPLLAGAAKAKYYLLTGDLLSATEAERIGLVTKVVPADEFKTSVSELARRLAKGPPKILQWTKLAANKRIKDEVNLVLDASLAVEFLGMETNDYAEAINAFIEKREPKYTGT